MSSVRQAPSHLVQWLRLTGELPWVYADERTLEWIRRMRVMEIS